MEVDALGVSACRHTKTPHMALQPEQGLEGMVVHKGGGQLCVTLLKGKCLIHSNMIRLLRHDCKLRLPYLEIRCRCSTGRRTCTRSPIWRLRSLNRNGARSGECMQSIFDAHAALQLL